MRDWSFDRAKPKGLSSRGSSTALCPQSTLALSDPSTNTIPALTANTAPTASSPPRKLPPSDRAHPIMYGPKYPPRFPTELITAMLAAAPAALNRDVASAQNGPVIDCAPTIPKLIPAITRTGVQP